MNAVSGPATNHLILTHMKSKYLILMTVLLSIQNLFLVAQERIKARDEFNWQEFSSSSSIDKDSIDYEKLQGNWISRETHHYSDNKIATKAKTGNAILEIKGDKYRKSINGRFNTFQIDKNMIVFNTDLNPDTAFINKITDKELIISFKSDINYTQYCYEK
jgi:hypothetical protein